MVTRVMNIRQFADFTKKFPGEMEKAGFRINEVLARSYQQRIKRRAVGRLKDISVKAQGKESIAIQYPNAETAKIARLVNRGAHPGHPIPRQLMDASRAGKKTAGRKSRSVLGNLNPQDIIWVQPKISPTAINFLTNSMETLQRDTPKLIEEEIQRTFNAI